MSKIDIRQKRLLSPTSDVDLNLNDKRVKGNEKTTDFTETNEADPVLDIMADLPEKEPTLLDLKRYMDVILAQANGNGKKIENLATKTDFQEVEDQMTAQGTEIDQLRLEITQISQRY